MNRMEAMNNTKTPKTFSKDKILPIVKTVCRFLPAILLAIFLIVSLVKADFQIRGEDKTDLIYLIIMILMLGISVILGVLKHNRISRGFGLALYAVVPFVSFFLLEYYTHNPFKDNPVMDQNLMILNALFFYVILFFVTALSTRSDVAIAVTAVIPMLFGLANHMAMEFRNAPIFSWDVLSFGTAVSILDNYTLELTTKLFFILYVFVFMISVAFLCGFRFRLKKLWMNAIVSVVALCLLGGYCYYVTTDDAEDRFDYYPYLFSASYLYKHNGCAVSFISTTKYLKLDPPDGYDADDLRAIYDEYHARAEETVKDDAVMPNIIVIMNEAFSDPATIWDLETNVDYLPFIHSITDTYENAAVGQVYVSVKGGNTPNSEFEFLTGTSMAYLPAGSIPFQQHIKSETMSLVSQLNALGYLTAGMHPYGSTGWDRHKVYPYLGFDETYFRNDFKNRKTVRNYISDETMYRQIMTMQESKQDGEPLFVFGVTMQNHGDYPNKSNGNFHPDVAVLNNKNSYISYFNNYLSLLKVSDKAFQKLVEYYEKIDEPTVILMFGDHQPNDHVVSPILKANGISMTNPTLDTLQTRYVTPYVLWANYHLKGLDELPKTTSVNYLATLLLSLTDVPMTPFQCWQMDLMKEYPALNANGYFDADWNGHSVQYIYDESLLNVYAQLQYNLVFDRRNTVSELFSSVGVG